MNATIPTATGSRRIWLRVGTLLDGESAAPLRDAHLVYEQQQVVFVGEQSPPREALDADQRVPDAELPDYTLLPGLIDAHTHLFLEGGELDPGKRSAYLKQSPAQLLDCAIGRLDSLLRLGVVACRDAGDKDGVGLAISRLCASADRRPMPYVDSPGAAIHHRGRYGSFMAEPLEDFPTPLACVEARVEAGADRIKLIPTGIIDFKKGAVTSAPQMTADEVGALVAAARSFGKQTLAHASGDAGIDHAIDGGVDTIEHGFFVSDEQLARMRERNIAWVPTFAPVQKQLDHADRMGYGSNILTNLQRILDRHAGSLVRAHRLGVTILAGSDAGSYGVPHGLGLLYEMELMERAGLSPVAVIKAATGAAANRLAFRESLGRVRPGMRSRFILTARSPLETVANLQESRTVIFDGAILEAAAEADASGL